MVFPGRLRPGSLRRADLKTRPASPAEDGTKRWEFGAIGHGAAGRGLARQVAEEVCAWNVEFRTRSARFEIPDARLWQPSGRPIRPGPTSSSHRGHLGMSWCPA
jgi:hypothetical protein